MPSKVSIGSRAYRTFRAELKASWKAQNAACGICHQATIDWDGPKGEPDSFELDHITSRKRLIALGQEWRLLDPKNAQPSHRRCNGGKQAGDAHPGLGDTSEDW
jgi:hypothetical protein